MENDQIPITQPNLPQNPEIIQPLITTTKPKISRWYFFTILLIIIACLLGIIYIYSKNKELQQKHLAKLGMSTPSPSQVTLTSPITSPNPDIDISPDNEVCPISTSSLQNDTYPKNISTDGTMCKFSMFDEYDKNKITYSIRYPQKWQVGIVGAAYANLNFQKSRKESVLMIDMVTKLPLETVNKAEYCYEGCSPVMDTEEKEISKNVKTLRNIKVMEVISSIDAKQIKRYFYLTNHKYDNGNQLFVFEYTPTNQEFDAEIIGVIKSLVEFPTK